MSPLRFLVLVLGWSFSCVAYSQSYSFTTLAGLPGVSGDANGTNDSARFYFPAGIAVDGFGNLYVAEILNHTIRKITPVGTNWVVSTIAGMARVPGFTDGTNSEARFDHPNGVTVDSFGNVFVADHYNHTIRKIAPVGTNWVVSTIAGSPGARNHDDGTNSGARFYSPTGIAVDKAGHLYVADTANFTIREITPIGTNWVVSTLAGLALNYGFADGTNDEARFDFPYDVTVSSSGRLYVGDWGNHAIREIIPQGPAWIVGTIAGLSGGMGSDDGIGRKADFNFPNGIASDRDGNLYVADQENNTIRRLTPPTRSDWNVSTIGGLVLQSGSSNGVGSNARFNNPWGVAVDAAGNLYVSDYGNHTIRKGVPPWGATPALRIQLFGNQVVLSWPASATNFLPETSALLFPVASWSAVTNPLTIYEGFAFVTNRMDTATAYYRLRRP